MSESSGTKTDIVKRFLTETKSADQFAAFFTADALYCFGNSEPIVGRDRIQESSMHFRQKLKSVSHDIKAIWELGDTVVCEMEAAYTRLDGKVLTLPVLDVFNMKGDQFREMHVYMDISPVFA